MWLTTLAPLVLVASSLVAAQDGNLTAPVSHPMDSWLAVASINNKSESSPLLSSSRIRLTPTRAPQTQMQTESLAKQHRNPITHLHGELERAAGKMPTPKLGTL